MNKITKFLTKHAKWTLISGVLVLVASGIYGIGLFDSLKSDDNFFAKNTQSQKANEKLEALFGKTGESDAVVLFEKKSGVKVDITSREASSEVQKVLSTLKNTKVNDYYLTKEEAFLSKDRSATFAVVTLAGSTSSEQYKNAVDFQKSVKSDLFNVSLGGSLIGRNQTQDQVKEDLAFAEMVSLPILAVLLFVFFKSPIAAALPLVMSMLTIAGGLAVVRLVGGFVAVDTYSLNVITILGVGLSIDYCLLAVNRFREELSAGRSVEDAATVTAHTAGRTVLFSGITVALCLLALLVFPVGFMHSVSIGGTAAVAVAVIISTLLLPAALRVVGKNINKWHVGREKAGKHNAWGNIASVVTKHPVVSIVLGLSIVTLALAPVFSFKTAVFDWHVLPTNLSAHQVGQALNDKFETNTSSVTVLADFGRAPTVSDICTVASKLKNVTSVQMVTTAYSQLTPQTCQEADLALYGVRLKSPESYTLLSDNAKQYIANTTVRYDIVSKYEASDSRTFDLVTTLRGTTIDEVTMDVTGTAALSKDTLSAYSEWMPVAGALIALAMLVILSLLLGSLVIPLQAIVINSLPLLIAVAALVSVFQFGWATSLLRTVTTGGFDPSIPILVVVMAFGLSMDYAVFLYSRIHEIYDKKQDVTRAIVEGVAKTGPIISAAAMLMFVVVAALGLSHVALIQQVGIGLAVAVLVDAFFVRIFFVPAVMKLFGSASWWGPKWLKKITIKHE